MKRWHRARLNGGRKNDGSAGVAQVFQNVSMSLTSDPFARMSQLLRFGRGLGAFAALGSSPWLLPCPNLAASSPDAQISHIEGNLLPTVQIRGRSITARSLTDEMVAHHIPSVSIAVVDNGLILWAKTYGFADLSSKRPATISTLYQAGSMSKPVTASAAMQLVEEGRIELDSPVKSRPTSSGIPLNILHYDQPITLRQILTHTAGLTVSGFGGYDTSASIPSIIEIIQGKPPANNPPIVVDLTPGTAWRYSGGGYVIAQFLMVEADGRNFPELMRDRVLLPVGMAASTFEQPLPSSRSAEAATGYLADGRILEGRFHVYPEMAAAGLWTTPSDLARWVIALERAYNGERSSLMSQTTARAMLTPGLGNWGLGIAIKASIDGFLIVHGGSNLGFKGSLVGWPKGERAVVAMANGDDGMAVIDPLVAAVAREYGWAGMEPKIIDSVDLTAIQRGEIIGSYGGGGMTISSEGDRLIGHAFGRTFELVPQGDDHFLADLVPIVAQRGADGRVNALKIEGKTTLNRDR